MTDQNYIKRCIQLAKNGTTMALPNPSVGAVIVYDNKIIGEGFTSEYGGSHAEVNAINSVKDKHLLKKSTLYVTLEPCSHFGKTPPCSDLIIKNQIPNVVIGCIDDNSLVAGKGVKKLKAANVNVTVGILEEECKQLHKRFFTFHNKKRPYIFLKWAQTSDGFISPETTLAQKREPIWITNSYSKQHVHKQRAQEEAILVGTNTVVADNPSLSSRLWEGSNCTRVILDLNLRISLQSNVFDNTQPTIVITSKHSHPKNNTNIIFELIEQNKCIAKQVADILYKHNIQSVIIEGGQQTLQTFIDANLWDEASVYINNEILFYKGTKAPYFIKNVTLLDNIKIKTDTLKLYKND